MNKSDVDVREKFIRFFEARGHKSIPSAPLVPEGDSTSLFNSSGMQPLIQNLLGMPHPMGKRLVNSQKCIRVQDIEDVGDNRHTTFFEMLGNWSFGDYFKDEQLEYFFEFLTNKEDGLGLDPQKLFVTVFSGDKESDVSIDTEAIDRWKELFKKKWIDAKEIILETEEKGYELGMQGGRIFAYGAKKNWWSRSGIPSNMPPGEPGGPDSEVFYDFGTSHSEKFGKHCHPNCDCGRFVEIGNSVFMQYQKQSDGTLKELSQKNVDFGGGFERLTAAIKNENDVFKTNLFSPIITAIEKTTGKSYDNNKSEMRIIADHVKASVFLISDGVEPSNKGQGYVLRRLLRRATMKMYKLEKTTNNQIFETIADSVLDIYNLVYFDKEKVKAKIENSIGAEILRFNQTLDQGLKMIGKVSPFDLYQTYGFPIEITEELYKEKNLTLDKKEFDKEKNKHQELSRTASAGMFRGGLQDRSEITTKYHTATHLLHAALRQVLGNHVSQKGSNITGERLRFDFSYPNKLTLEQINEIENLVNQKIQENLAVEKKEMKKSEALAMGALAFFPEKYPEVTSVYKIGDFSMELCGGPHVASTGSIGRIKIMKEESAGAGIRRIYATAISEKRTSGV